MKHILLIFLITVSVFCFSQGSPIYSYYDANTGAYGTINENLSGSYLSRVNGAMYESCGTGYTSSGFSDTEVFDTTLAAIQFTITPDPGYIAQITQMYASLRRSGTGPQNVRFAYSINGGEWIDDIDQAPHFGPCGSTVLCNWNFEDTATINSLRVRFYGFNAIGPGGELQFFNIILYGYVPDYDVDEDGFNFDEDCNDTIAGIHPGATEICNSMDDDCNGLMDDGLIFTTWYADADDDGYGNVLATVSTCDGAPSGFVADSTDCNDTDNLIYPAAIEICNGTDDNCNLLIDDGLIFTTWYADADSDNYGDVFVFISTCNGAPTGYVADSSDCNDADSLIFPTAIEICNGIDENCNDLIDEGLIFETWYADADGDDFGDDTVFISTCDGAPDGYIADSTDCDDTNPNIFPGAEEIINGVDDNCDELIDNIQDGILSNLAGNSILVFPNPVSTFVNFIPTDKNFKGYFILFDATGKKMVEFRLSDDLTSADLTLLPNGIYFYLIRNEMAPADSGILVKQ